MPPACLPCPQAVKALRFDGVAIPPDYTSKVQRALWTFRHQRVFCVRLRSVVHLRPVVGGDLASAPDAFVPTAAAVQEGEEDFLGPELADDVAQAIAEGRSCRLGRGHRLLSPRADAELTRPCC